MEKIKNIIFISLIKIDDINQRGIYTDLLREFQSNGHNVTIVFPFERRENQKTNFKIWDNISYLGVKSLNIQKANIIEKGLGTILIEYLLLHAAKKYLKTFKYDLIIYTTPPITFYKTIKYLKLINNAKTYLLLKDIFPQNAVDLGLISKKSLLYKLFRSKEKKLYRITDYIGCMSEANVEYILANNKYLSKENIEINPNSITPKLHHKKNDSREILIRKYNLNKNAIIILYSGNLGISQGVEFLSEIIISNKTNETVYFFIVGSGVKYNFLEKTIRDNKINNSFIIPYMKKDQFDDFVEGCDIGLVLLNPLFTYPNFPSRILSYMENKMPVISATDQYTDIGKIISINNFGYNILNGQLDLFNKILNNYTINPELITIQGDNAYNYLINNYTSQISYNIIKKHFV